MSEVRIGSQTAGYSGFTSIGLIETTSGDFESSATMMMNSLVGMNIDGDFDADVTIKNAMTSSSTLFRIGGSFATTAVLSLPANGLVGSIRINANGGSGQFLGDVKVGNTTLNTNYTTLSKDLGNGVAGAAPYNFHQFTGPLPSSRNDLDCNPFHTEFLAVGDCEAITDLNEAIIDHYGPVFVSGEGPHYRVEFLPAFFDPSTGPQWINVTDQFEVDESRTATASNTSNRKVYIVPSKDNASAFNAASASAPSRTRSSAPMSTAHRMSRINPASSPATWATPLRARSTTGTSSASPCPPGSMLFEGNQVNASDLAAWIDNPFEVNMDGRVCAQDFALMSGAYDPE